MIDLQASPCWQFTGHLNPNGYGVIFDVKPMLAHRYAYMKWVGPIPEGLELDHLCRVRHCVNPAHLEPVTHQENIKRGETGIDNRMKWHCPKGHVYDVENTRHYRGSRHCRACDRDRKARAKRERN